MIKQMTWSDMQKHTSVSSNTAFYELAQFEVLEVFDLIEFTTNNNIVKTIITEENSLITVELVTS
ncbi:MAG: hypothetical protein DRQ47_08115 [Gammaproteobacteria bacterium]|nr:MAG: hypothetical protein DRQ47_08115 [Gammaproteobacteria bacterium]